MGNKKQLSPEEMKEFYFGKLAGLLLTGDPEQKIVGFRRGGIVCLERDEAEKWSVRWVLPPEILAE